MRYIINDDDLESWVEKLKKINELLANADIQYIVEEIQLEINYQNKEVPPNKQDKNNEN